jgi:hypothetical protein
VSEQCTKTVMFDGMMMMMMVMVMVVMMVMVKL